MDSNPLDELIAERTAQTLRDIRTGQYGRAGKLNRFMSYDTARAMCRKYPRKTWAEMARIYNTAAEVKP